MKDAVCTALLAIFLAAVKTVFSGLAMIILWMLCSFVVGGIHSRTPECLAYLQSHPYEDPQLYGQALILDYLKPYRTQIVTFVASSYATVLFLLITGGLGAKEDEYEHNNPIATNFSNFCISPAIVLGSIVFVILAGFGCLIQKAFKTRH